MGRLLFFLSCILLLTSMAHPVPVVPVSPAAVAPNVRVVYAASRPLPAKLRPQQRESSSPVQYVAYTDRILPALFAAPPIRTVIIVRPRPGAPSVDREWFRALSSLENVTVLNYGGAKDIHHLPAGWRLIQCAGTAMEGDLEFSRLLQLSEPLPKGHKSANP